MIDFFTLDLATPFPFESTELAAALDIVVIEGAGAFDPLLDSNVCDILPLDPEEPLLL